MKTIFLLFLLLPVACTTAPKTSSSHYLVLTTDFGLKDGAVSEMKGVAYDNVPGLVISDLTHEIPPYNIWEASYRLQQTYAYWPKGTVFVTVVDPGVGSERKTFVARTKSGHYFVGPDNGHLTLLQDEIESVRWINEKVQRRKGSEESYTFHGRDLFVLVGARLAGGVLAFDKVGELATTPLIQLPYQKPMVNEQEALGQIPVLDPNYGNVWTNIPKKDFAGLAAGGKSFRVRLLHDGKIVYDKVLPLLDTFSAVRKSEPLLYFNSLLNLSLALNQDNFAAKFKISSGPGWTIRVTRP